MLGQRSDPAAALPYGGSIRPQASAEGLAATALPWRTRSDCTAEYRPSGCQHRSADLRRRAEGSCPWPAVDPDNRPRFEAQATFLDRHGLLKADERRRLPPDAFDPEAVVIAE